MAHCDISHCDICDKDIGLFGGRKGIRYCYLESRNKYICKTCFEEVNITNENEKEALIQIYLEKIGYFVNKGQYNYAEMHCKKLLLLDYENFGALALLAEISAETVLKLKSPGDEGKKQILMEVALCCVTKLINLYVDDSETWEVAEKVFDKLGQHNDAATCALNKKRLEALRKSQLDNENSEEDEPKNFDEVVKGKCDIKTNKGILVQSKGEKLIADFLFLHKIDFDYDEQITLMGNEKNKNGYLKSWIRPDFYLTEFNIIIEYWGLEGTPDYDERMQEKKRLYKEANKKFISIGPEDISSLDATLKVKLDRLGCSIK